MALGIRGLGRHYKRGSGFIVGGVSGGAAIPPLLGHVADIYDNTGIAMVVPTAVCIDSFLSIFVFSLRDRLLTLLFVLLYLQVMVGAWTYAICVNFVPPYRDPADKIGASTIGIENAGAKSDEEAVQEGEKKGDSLSADAEKPPQVPPVDVRDVTGESLDEKVG